eukprot:Nk52_evm38s96 gene=Nk52_evmTU38s96
MQRAALEDCSFSYPQEDIPYPEYQEISIHVKHVYESDTSSSNYLVGGGNGQYVGSGRASSVRSRSSCPTCRLEQLRGWGRGSTDSTSSSSSSLSDETPYEVREMGQKERDVDIICTHRSDNGTERLSEMDFKRHLVTGYVRVVLKDDVPNALDNIMVTCTAEMTGNEDDILWKECQQNSASFEDLPGGEYDIPFEFIVPYDCPASFGFKVPNFKGGPSSSIFLSRQILYFVTATIIQRKRVSTSVGVEDKKTCFNFRAPFKHYKIPSEFNRKFAGSPKVVKTEKRLGRFKKSQTPTTLSVQSAEYGMVPDGRPNEVTISLGNVKAGSLKGVHYQVIQKLSTEAVPNAEGEEDQEQMSNYWPTQRYTCTPKEKINLEDLDSDSKMTSFSKKVSVYPQALKVTCAQSLDKARKLLAPSSVINGPHENITVEYMLIVEALFSYGQTIQVEVPIEMCNYDYGDVATPDSEQRKMSYSILARQSTDKRKQTNTEKNFIPSYEDLCIEGSICSTPPKYEELQILNPPEPIGACLSSNFWIPSC